MKGWLGLLGWPAAADRQMQVKQVFWYFNFLLSLGQ